MNFILLIGSLVMLSQAKSRRQNGQIQTQMMFFATHLLPHESEHHTRQLQQLDESKSVSADHANQLVQQFLKDKAIMNSHHHALQKRITREFFKSKEPNLTIQSEIPYRMLQEAISSDEILYFANKWTTWMYFDLLKELSIHKEGMTISEAYSQAETYGLSFQTWRVLKNEPLSFEDDDRWDDDNLEDTDTKDEDVSTYVSTGDWVQDMQESMASAQRDHAKRFEDMERQFAKAFKVKEQDL